MWTYWWLFLTLCHSWVLGNYVVHFSSGQGLEREAPEEREQHETSPPARHAVNLSVAGHRFHCQLPGVGDGHGSHGDGGAYAALLRSAALKGRCISGWTDDEQEFEVCLGHRFMLGPHVAWHQPPDGTTGPKAGPDASGGFEQRYVGSEVEATLECGCAPRRERKESEAEACALGQHVWISESDSSPWMAMVVGADESAELTLRRSGRGEERHSFRVARQRLRSAEDGRSCAESRKMEKMEVKASRIEDSKFLLRLQAPSCCKMAPMEDIHATIMSLLAPLEGTCQYVQNGWWTYELCWPWHVRRMHYHTVATPEAHIFRALQGEDPAEKTTISGATQAEVGSVGGVMGFFAAKPNLELRRSLVGKRPAGFRGPSAWPQEVVVPLDSGDDCRIAANTWLISVTGFGATTPVVEVPGVGGPFNPVTLDSAEGFLATSDGNEDGCDVFQERFDGKVLLVKRGNCFFQVKANNAEDAGAVAVIVYNDQRPPVESMEGVEELLPPRIPGIFVHTEKGLELLGHLGQRAKVMKVGHEHLQLSEPITGSVVFRCSEDFQREKMCQAGDTVDVKLWVKSSAKPKPRLQPAGASDQELHELAVLQAQVDSSSLRMLRGQVLAAEEGSLLVQWLGEQEQDIILGTVPGMNLESEAPARVPLSAAFRNGVQCAASREAWIEKLLEPYACTAEFVVHVASLCALPQLSPQKPREQQGIHCQMERAV